MILTQLLSPRELLGLSQAQLDTIDTMIQAEIIKSKECMDFLKQKLDQEYLPVIKELKSRAGG